MTSANGSMNKLSKTVLEKWSTYLEGKHIYLKEYICIVIFCNFSLLGVVYVYVKGRQIKIVLPK